MKRFLCILLALAALFSFTGCEQLTDLYQEASSMYQEITSETPYTDSTLDAGQLIVHFIDVGQADSIFIELPDNKTMLIDGGNKGDGPAVVQHIFNQGYDTVNYVVATHLHEDHIGGLPEVLNNFKVDYFIYNGATATTKIYQNMMDKLQENGAASRIVKEGDVLADDLYTIQILAPAVIDSKTSTNSTSIVIRIVYKNTSFIFMGDAESDEEGYISGDIQSDVIKIGHHGSDSSSSSAFLDQVSPKYAVISCELHNKYNHPSQSTLDKLYGAGIQVFRTDGQGTIKVVSDGETYTWDKQPVPEGKLYP